MHYLKKFFAIFGAKPRSGLDMSGTIALCEQIIEKAKSELMEEDYGHGFVAKKLANGQWVLFYKCYGVDMRGSSYYYRWRPGDKFFKDCCTTKEHIDKVIKDVMSFYGV